MKSAVVFLLFFFIGFFAIFAYNRWNQKQSVFQAKKSVQVSAQKISFSVEKAPSESLKAQIISITGDVLWESRVATQASKLTDAIFLQQGESVETSENGSMTVVMQNAFELTVSKNTKLSFIQTLPENIVFGQSKGKVTYAKINEDPLSVRSLHLLVVSESGTMTVLVNEEDGIVSVSVSAGTAGVAFNDLENIATKVTLEKGQEYLFNDETRVGEILY